MTDQVSDNRRPRRYWPPICLVPHAGSDQFVRMPPAWLLAGKIEHCGRAFYRTARRTVGGWPIYVEA